MCMRSQNRLIDLLCTTAYLILTRSQHSHTNVTSSMIQGLCRRRAFSLSLWALLIATTILLYLSLYRRGHEAPPCPVWTPAEARSASQPSPPLPPIRAPPDAPDPTDLFNVTLAHGHWDRQRMFRTYYFVSVGTNFTRLSERYVVTLASQASLDKLHSIVQVAVQWTGPISVALYAAGDDEYHLLAIYLSYLRQCFVSIRARVAFHLTVPNSRLPLGQPPSNTKGFVRDSLDCRRPEAVLKSLLKARSQTTVRWRLKNAYPQNHLRNTARKTSQTNFVFLTDIDIVPSGGLADRLDVFLKSSGRVCAGKCAYVIPTYELDDRASFPWSKKDLIRLSKKGLARPFHQKVFIFNQFATNFSRWERYNDADEENVVVSHNVTNFEFLYEPFYVAADTAPDHDERFIGYGYTRNTQVYEMYVAGYQFHVLSPIFTIHWGLQVKKGRPSWRERQNTLNRKHFDQFKKEVFAKYFKDPLHMLT